MYVQQVLQCVLVVIIHRLVVEVSPHFVDEFLGEGWGDHPGCLGVRSDHDAARGCLKGLDPSCQPLVQRGHQLRGTMLAVWDAISARAARRPR